MADATAGTPHVLGDNRVPVYYAGGSNINDFRQLPVPVSGPEDWVGSMVPLPAAILGADADPTTGISRLPDGSSLADRITADPVGWLGADVAGAFGGSSALLVKLLDAGERLPVHCHPTRAFAQGNLGSLFGKTEGWIVMHAEPEACIWIGFEDQIDRTTLRGWVEQQDVTSMLAAMMRLQVSPGDVVYVPAGIPHAIGPGVMITELQEPTSFSVLAEYEVFGVDSAAATLGLGWDLALSCFDLAGYRGRAGELLHQPQLLQGGSGGRVERLFGEQADEYFRALRMVSSDSVALPDPSFCVLVVTQGAGHLAWGDGRMPVHAGMTLVVPYGAGPIALEGTVQAIACLPPVVR